MLGKVGYVKVGDKLVSVTAVEVTEDQEGYTIVLGEVLHSRQRIQFRPSSFHLGRRAQDRD